MKKFAVLLFVLCSILSVYASTSITSGESANFGIKGYFEATSETTYSFIVWIGESTRIYHSGNIVLEDLESFTDIEVFNWSFEWTSGTNLTLKFTFTPLQAYASKIYYIPAHTFTLSCDGKSDKTIEYSTKASGNFPYPEYTSDSDRIKSVNYNTSVSSTGSLEGSCTLSISDYESESSDDFVYENEITVEFCVE